MNEKIQTIVECILDIPGRFESAGRVYSTKGIAPTLPTGCGGGHLPKIIEYEEDERDKDSSS